MDYFLIILFIAIGGFTIGALGIFIQIVRSIMVSNSDYKEIYLIQKSNKFLSRTIAISFVILAIDGIAYAARIYWITP
ncbi:MAG: hypothetical protein V4665_00345 [Patescibacteria group bacterium]